MVWRVIWGERERERGRTVWTWSVQIGPDWTEIFAGSDHKILITILNSVFFCFFWSDYARGCAKRLWGSKNYSLFGAKMRFVRNNTLKKPPEPLM